MGRRKKRGRKKQEEKKRFHIFRLRKDIFYLGKGFQLINVPRHQCENCLLQVSPDELEKYAEELCYG